MGDRAVRPRRAEENDYRKNKEHWIHDSCRHFISKVPIASFDTAPSDASPVPQRVHQLWARPQWYLHFRRWP